MKDFRLRHKFHWITSIFLTILLVTGHLILAQTITGPTCVQTGTVEPWQYGSNSIPPGNTRTWCVTGGIIRYPTGATNSGNTSCLTTSSVNVINVGWNNGITTGSVNLSASGYGSTTLTVNVPPALQAGTVSPSTQTKDYNTTPTTISGTAASGGACAGGTYTYSWYKSTDNVAWTAIASTNTQNYSPAALTTTTYFRRYVVTSFYMSGYSTTATVFVNPQFLPGTLTAPAGSITYNTSPGSITNTIATGGGCSGAYTYVWEKSLDSINFTVQAGANQINYDPGNLTVTSWFRRKATCGSQTAYTNKIKIPVAAILTPGTIISPVSNPIPYNTSPGQITGSVPTGGSSMSSYVYQWESSNDSINFTVVSGATTQHHSPAVMTGKLFFRRKVTCGSEVKYSNITGITVANPPLTSGTITSPLTATVAWGEVPASIITTPATGGSCSGIYLYHWQFSYTGSNFEDIEEDTAEIFNFFEPVDSVVFFRRKVVCGIDSVYTQQVAITVIQPFQPGVITSPNQAVMPGAVPSAIIATPASYGSCSGSYFYQWQISPDGLSFTNLSAMNAQNLSYTQPIEHITYFRRKATCASESKYSNTIAITLRDTSSVPANEKSAIDSLLEIAAVNVDSLLNIISDSVANERVAADPSLLGLDSLADLAAGTSIIPDDYTPLEPDTIDSILNAPAQDSTAFFMAISSEGGPGVDSIPVEYASVNDSIVQNLRTQGNYDQLDSLIDVSPMVTFEQASMPLEIAAVSGVPDSLLTTSRLYDATVMQPTAVINGPALIQRDSTLHYVGNFNNAVTDSSDVQWVVKGGQIISQNSVISNGPLFANVKWTSSFGIPYIGIISGPTKQYQTFPIYFSGLPCRVFPVTQSIMYGLTPAGLSATSCGTVVNSTSIQYQWQVVDVYSGGAWSDIPGANSANYQPPAFTSSTWLMYRRVSKYYNSSMLLLSTQYTNGVSVKLAYINGGQIKTAQTQLKKNTVPVITRNASFGGITLPSSNIQYTWEYSIDNGPWQVCGTGMSYPNCAVTVTNTRIRRVAKVMGLAASYYDLPSKYWMAYSNILNFTTFYETVDYENRNYIRENIVLTRGIQTWEQADALPNGQKKQNTNYLDGLSRSNQIVEKGFTFNEQSNQWIDLVSVSEHGAGGRIDKTLVPYPSIENPGKYKLQFATQQPQFYATAFAENHAFSQSKYDNSPLNRKIETFNPGDSWVGNSVKKTSDFEPYLQSEGVRIFSIASTPSSLPTTTTIYPDLFLMKKVELDEKGKKTISYLNKLNQVILTKTQLADAGASLSTHHDGWLCMYYVYDDFGNIRYHITPEAVKQLKDNNWIMTTSIASELCFSMEYDELSRVIVKKSPGKAATFIVYNKRNQQILIQDGNLRAKSPQQWRVMLPDPLGRPVMEGVYSSNSSRENLQILATAANAEATVNTTYGGNVKLWGSPLSASTINNSSSFAQTKFHYYDGYTYSGAKTFNASALQNMSYQNSQSSGDVESSNQSLRTLGLPTGSRSRVVEDGSSTPSFLVTIIFFDEDKRVIQRQEEHIKGGTDITSSQFHFDGRMLSTSQIHNVPGTSYAPFVMLTKYGYDQSGQLNMLGKKINSAVRSYSLSAAGNNMEEDLDDSYKILATYKHDEFRRIKNKILAPGYNQGQGLETIDYTYNFRGWLTGINKGYALGQGTQWDHFFGQVIGYDNKDGLFDTHQFDGTVTGTIWKSQGDNNARKFNYVYDNANRLTTANFRQQNDGTTAWTNDKMDFTTNNIVYDLNGNIQSMQSFGKLPGAGGPTSIDNLAYTYKPGSNELLRVDDGASTGQANGKQRDFVDGTNAALTDDYTYDENGNLTMDKNKNITSIEYNYLNKPALITLSSSSTSNGGSIKYVYDASGVKLKKVVTHNAGTFNNNQTSVITTSYIGDFNYESVSTNGSTATDELTLINHEEGRIRVISPYTNSQDPSNVIDGGLAFPDQKQGVFDYYITDHLDNIRTTVTEEINKSSSVCTMEEANSTIKAYEESIFGNEGSANEVVTTRFNRPTDWTTGTPSGVSLSENLKVSKLQAVAGVPQTGPNSLLKVMAGDKIGARADYYYLQDPSSAQTSTALTGLLQSLGLALIGDAIPSAISTSKTLIENGLNGNVPLSDMFSDASTINNPNTNAPRAYLNYLFFDEQFNFIEQVSGFKRVSSPGDGASPLIVTDIKAVKNGYVYVYLSNESGEPVYFDNFAVSHQKGQLIADDHYYAYGSKIGSISSQSLGSSLRKNLTSAGFQGLHSEEINDFDLSYNEFPLRTYDPQIGRWLGQDPYQEFPSPYTGMGNNPASGIDPSGGSFITTIINLFKTASGIIPCPSVTGALATGSFTAGSIAKIAVSSFAIGITVSAESYNNKVGELMATTPNNAALNATTSNPANSGDFTNEPPDDPTGLNQRVTLNDDPNRPDEPWDLDGDRKLSKSEADNWRKNGNGVSIIVQAEFIDLGYIPTEHLEDDQFVRKNLFKDPEIIFSTGWVYGTLDMHWNKIAGGFEITANDYDFDVGGDKHPWTKELVRNFYTAHAGAIAGKGETFTVIFQGVAKPRPRPQFISPRGPYYPYH